MSARDTLVVVPAYNEAGAVGDVVRDLRAADRAVREFEHTALTDVQKAAALEIVKYDEGLATLQPFKAYWIYVAKRNISMKDRTRITCWMNLQSRLTNGRHPCHAGAV